VSDASVLIDLLERCRRDHAAWINGDGSPYALPDDGTILGAVGGYSRGGRDTLERQRAVAAQWRSGTGDVELLNGGVSGDLAWLVMIEHAVVSFTSDTVGTERRWDLRVTEVFRRSGAEWVRVHRHADPLVDRRPLTEVARLLT
jgi:ketosteroid isomerase-like protein